MEARISIIVPIYNAEKTLKKCVSSLCLQSYKNIEILLIDDGSTDNSINIEEQLAAKDSRIKVIKNRSNCGLVKARQIGVQNASGEYIGFVDADDWVEPEMYQVLYQKIKEYNADVSSCRIRKDYPDGTVKYNFDMKCEKVFSPEDAIKNLNNERNIEVSLACKLINKKLFDINDFDMDITIGEDYRTIHKVLFRAHRVVGIEDGFYHYIQNPKSMCYRGYSGNGNNTLDNYTQIKNEIIDRFPDNADAVTRYWSIQEMAVVVSMVKANRYDMEIVKKVRNDIKLQLKYIMQIKELNFYYKICALLLSLNEQLLIIPYKILYYLYFSRKIN